MFKYLKAFGFENMQSRRATNEIERKWKCLLLKMFSSQFRNLKVFKILGCITINFISYSKEKIF